jgi:hypothetical protein
MELVKNKIYILKAREYSLGEYLAGGEGYIEKIKVVYLGREGNGYKFRDTRFKGTDDYEKTYMVLKDLKKISSI